MQFEVNSKSIREMADRIAKAHPTINKPLALEIAAHGFGYRNFDTLSGVLRAEASSRTKPVDTAKLLATPVTLWMQCFACDSSADSPDWARQDLTATFLDSVLKQRALCQANGLSHVSEWTDPTDWHEDDEYGFNMRDWQLYVSADGFWFRGCPKHCDYAVETRAVYFDELVTLLEARTGGNEVFCWFGEALYRDGNNAQGLFDLIEESTAAELSIWDRYEVAEWVGLHYKVNFFAEPDARQKEWIQRYTEAHRDTE